MKYKTAFSFNNEENKELQNEFNLTNYVKYEPELESEFYLKYFIKQLLFKTDILDLKRFLEHHYHYCDNPEKFYQILEYKVIPKTLEIIDNAQAFGNSEARSYNNEDSNGFVKIEGIFRNEDYDYPIMLHQTDLFNLKHSFRKKIQIMTQFINDYKDSSQPKPLKWAAGPSHLAIIVGELIDKGYMNAEKSRGEINNSKLARELFNSFEIESCDSPKSIEIYLSPNNKRNKVTKASFVERGFNIPDVNHV